MAQVVERAFCGKSRLPGIKNEPYLAYKPGSAERAALAAACQKLRNTVVDVPCVVGGQEIRSGNLGVQNMPTDHHHAVCNFHKYTEDTLRLAVEKALEARKRWSAMPLDDRLAIFLKAADLLSGKYRAELAAAVMLGTGKNVWQAEIDVVECIDFWRMNCVFAEQIYNMQPTEHMAGTWNKIEYRPVEGFLVAVSPFNFLAIGSNLASSPALMGNVVLSKVSSTAVLSNYIAFNILREAGLPDGVINFLCGDGALLGRVVFNHPEFAGLHFTGSTPTFNSIWRTIAGNLEHYRSYPRICGETGGKNFHFMHESAEVDNFVFQTIRSAFEYQGQKCSACSRAYVPDSVWPQVEAKLVEEMKKIKMGPSDDFSVFMTAVIDGASFKNIKGYIEAAKASDSCRILAGGECDDSVGWYVQPTVIVTTDPKWKSMSEEIFGPVLTLYVYPHAEFEQTCQLIDTTSAYALTGALFCKDRYALEYAVNALRNASGNFYINDKCTGAVVNQQAFGGARMSGTNDKSGSLLNLLRWVSPRAIKETFVSIGGWKYPHMD